MGNTGTIKPRTTTTRSSKVTQHKVTENPALVASLDAWRKHVITNWASLKKQATQAKVKTPYQELVVIAFTPVLPTSASRYKLLLKLMGKLRYSEALVAHIKTIYHDKNYKRTASDLARDYLNPEKLDAGQQIGLDWLLMVTGTLYGVTKKGKTAQTFAKTLLEGMRDTHTHPSAVRVQAGMISAGQNVIFAGQDVNVVSQYYPGNKGKLKAYLARLRADWNIPATNILPASQHRVSAILHQLYTPPDIWTDDADFKTIKNLQQLNERRFQAIDKDVKTRKTQTSQAVRKDLNDAREPALEAIATHPLMMFTGGAGTGKSSLCQFIVTALAYACDPSAEKDDGIKGLDLLGSSWIHGPMLPLYVGLREFSNASDVFPTSVKKSSADSLLKYIKQTADGIADTLEDYLTMTDVPTQGTLLVLDGLDEVYHENDRLILQRIIENWADRFPKCRIIITSRTYAYRQDAEWHLSERFISAELAPFTSKQMNSYIEQWYNHVAKTRPGTLGGRQVAQQHADAMATNLKRAIRNNKTLWPLARHPLMLTLLTLIHGDYRRLPNMRAELYEETVKLLDRWNIPLPTDKLHEKLSNINLQRMRAALKLVAFDLQSQQKHYHRYPTTIQRGQLLDKLMKQQKYGDGLGASIEDVLEYLATRNGILVSDTSDHYRFPHLSIQEYLAACALIDFYDECPMPSALKPASPEGWTFPENIGALLKYDHSRWRNVALFTGSILAAGTGQDVMRWQLIQELLPVDISNDIPENSLHCISVAAEIWSENYLKARKIDQRAIKAHLIRCLNLIKADERIDAPERTSNNVLLARISAEQD